MVTKTSTKRVTLFSGLKPLVLVLFVMVAGLTLFTLPSLSSNSRVALAAGSNNNTINFQARLQTASGALVPDGYYNVEFKLYDSSSSTGSSQGSCSGDSHCLWVETRVDGGTDNRVRVVDGYLSVQLGSVQAFSSSINWNQPLWLTMNIGGTGTSATWDGEMNPRIPLAATPFSITSEQLMSSVSGYQIILQAPNSATQAATITLPDLSGTVCVSTSVNCGSASQSSDIFLNGGNTFGSTALLGTNDNYGVNIETNGSTVESLSNTGQALFKNSTNSANAFQIQDASGTSLFNVNSSSDAINFQAGPSSPTVEINGNGIDFAYGATSGGGSLSTKGGDIYTGGGALYAQPATTGPVVQVSSGGIDFAYGAASGGGQLSLKGGTIDLQGGKIASSNPSDASLLVSAANGQTADIVDVTNPAGTVLSVNANGQATFQNSTNSTTAFQVQNSSSSSLLTADTSNMRVGVDVTFTQMAVPTGLTVANSGAPTSGGGLAASSTYYYQVTAIDSLGGETNVSNEVDNSTQTSSTCPTSGNCTIGLSWTAVPGAAGYHIYRTAANGAAGTETLYDTSLTNSYTDTGNGSALGTAAPTTNTAYTSTSVSNNNGQVVIGGNGTPTGQLYVGGNVPSVALSSITPYGGLGTAGDVYVQGNYEYVTYWNSNDYLAVYNISNPAAPQLLVADNLSFLGNPADGTLYVQGHYAYLGSGNGGGVYIFDVSNPASPAYVTLLNTAYQGNGMGPTSVYVQGNYLYIYQNTNGNTPQLIIANVANPAKPFIVGSVILSSSEFYQGNYIYVHGSYAYVGEGADSTQIVDVSNPSNPTIVSSGGGSFQQRGMTVKGTYMYTTGNGDLNVFDVSNPASITPVGSGFSTSGGLFSPVVSGQYLYAANYDSDLIEILNISNPADPVLVGTIPTTTNPYIINIQGRYAYSLDYNGTLQVYDLGGAYTQTLQAGSTETGSLQVDSNAQVSGGANIQGGLTVGGSTQMQGNLGVAGAADIQGSVLISGGNNQLSAPVQNAVTFAATGTKGGGSVTWAYEVTAVNSSGGETSASNSQSIVAPSNSNSTLSSTNYNIISWNQVSDATSYNIYRVAATGGTPSSTGLIGVIQDSSCSGGTCTFNDSGIEGLDNTPPTINSTSQLTVEGSALFKNTTNSISAFQVQDAAGTSILAVDTVNGRVGINTSTPLSALDVNGGVAIGSYAGTTAAPSNGLIVSGDVGIGVSSPSSALALANGDWISELNAAGSGYINMFSVNSNNEIQAGAAINVDGGIVLPTDGGQMTFSDLPIDSSAAAGTAESYTFRVGSANALTVYGQADGSGNAQNIRVAIGTSITPNYTLDVGGDVNTTGDYRINGSTVCTSSGCTSASGSGYYIQNGTSTQTANFNIQSASSSSVTASIQGASGQTAPILEVGNGAGTNLLTVSSSANAPLSVYAVDGARLANVVVGCAAQSEIAGATCNGSSGYINLQNAASESYTLQSMSNTTAANVFTLNALPSGTSSNLLQLQNNGSGVFTVGNGGATTIKTNANTTTAFQVQNAAGTNVLAVDTTNQRVNIGNVGTSTGQLYVGGSLPISAVGSVSLGSSTNSGYVAAQGKYAYVVASSNTSPYPAVIQTYDVSNPSSPSLIGSLNTNGQNYQININYVATMDVVGNYLYVGGYNTSNLNVVEIFNISDPTNITYIGTANTNLSFSSNYNLNSIAIKGNDMFVGLYATQTGVIQVFNINNPTNPVQIDNTIMPVNNRPQFENNSIQGDYLFMGSDPYSNAGSLVIYNITNPSNLVLTYNPGYTIDSNTRQRIVVSGGYAYLYMNNYKSPYTSYIEVFNIENPSSPSLVTTFTTGYEGYGGNMIVRGHYLYINNLNSGNIQIIDITNPSSPVNAGIIPNSSDPSFSLQGNYLYSLYGSATLQIFNLGGTYTQSLQSGSTETGSLQVDNNANISGDGTIQGNLSVDGTTNLQGSLGVAGSAVFSNSTNSTSAFQIQNAAGSTMFNADTTNGFIGVGGIASPGSLAMSTTNTGGSLSGSTTYYYKVTAVDAVGQQTAPSLEGTIAYTPLAAPTGTTVSTATGGSLSGSYYYKVAAVTPNGTTLAATPASNYPITTSGTNTVSWTSVSGATSYNVYRSTDGSTWYVNNVTTTSLTDNGTTPTWTTSATLPNGYSTTNTVSFTWSPVVGAVGYNIYRGTASGAENTLLNATPVTATSYTDNGSAAGTTVTPPATGNAYVNQLAGTASGANYLTNTTIRSSNNSSTAFQVQNAAGTNVLSVDTASQRVSIGNLGTATGQLYVSGMLNSTAIGTVSLNAGTGGGGDLVVRGNYAYVAVTNGPFQIYDISTPSTPILVGQTSSILNARGNVALSGNYAYITNINPNVIYIINVANPYAPTVVNTVTDANSTGTVYIRGKYLYLLDAAALKTYDISNPLNPILVNTNNSIDSSYPDKHAITIVGQYLYATGQVAGANALAIFDLKNPAVPSEISSVNITSAESVTVGGIYAYVAGTSMGGIDVVNVANPSNPHIVYNGGPSGSGNPGHLLGISGHYLYAEAFGDLVIMDISDPLSPYMVTPYTNLDIADPAAYIQGRYLYTITGSSTPQNLQVFDLGGTYSQQLQAGNTETSTLQVDSNATVSGSQNIGGSQTVSGSTNLLSSLSVAGTTTLQSDTNIGSSGYGAKILTDDFESGSTFAPWWTATETGSSTVTVDNTYAHSGQYSMKMMDSGNGQAYLDAPVQQTTSIKMRAYLYSSSWSSSAGVNIFDTMDSAGVSSSENALYLNSSGDICEWSMGNGSGTGTCSTTVMPTNQWVQLEFDLNVNSTTGSFQAYVNGTAVNTWSAANTNVNTGNWYIRELYVGDNSGNNSTSTYWLDDFAADDYNVGSGSASLLVSDSLSVGGTASLGSTVVSADSSSAFQVQDATGQALLNVNTTGNEVDIYNGANLINAKGQLVVGAGNNPYWSGTYLSNYYDGETSLTVANNGNADLQDLIVSGNTVAKFNANGNLQIGGNGANNADNAFQVQNVSGNNVLNVDSKNNTISANASVNITGTSTTLPAIVQQSTDNGTGGAASVTFGAATHVGDTIVLLGQVSSGSNNISSVSGGGVATWNKITQTQVGGGGYEIEDWWGTVTSSGSSTVTATESGGGTDNVRLNVSEVSGLAANPVDVAASNTQTSTGTPTTPSITASANDIVFGQSFDNDTAPYVYNNGPTNGFTALNSPQNHNVYAYTTTSSGGSMTTGWGTKYSDNFENAIVAFKSIGTAPDILDVSSSSVTNVLKVDSTGATTLSTNSTTAFQVQNVSGSSAFNVDTTHNYVGIDNSTPTTNLDVGPTSLGSNQQVQIRVGDLLLQSQQGSANGITALTSRGSNGNLTLDGASGGGVYLSPYSTNNDFLAAGGGDVMVGSMSAPTAKLDVAGTTLIKTGSSQAFQIQDAAGINVVGVDTQTGNTTIGNSKSTAAVQEWDNFGIGLTTLSISPHATGNLITLAIKLAEPAITVSSVSGGGVSNWQYVTSNNDTTNGVRVELWEGVVSTTGSSTITVTYSSTPGSSDNCELVAQEFTAGLGVNTNWSVAASGIFKNPSSSTVTYPTLNAAQAGELYWGYSLVYSTGISGSDQGFTYANTSEGNQYIYDTNTTVNTYTPTATQTSAGYVDSVAMIISASTGSALTVNGSATVTGTNSPSAFQIQNASGTNVVQVDTTGYGVLMTDNIDTLGTGQGLNLGTTYASAVSIGNNANGEQTILYGGNAANNGGINIGTNQDTAVNIGQTNGAAGINLASGTAGITAMGNTELTTTTNSSNAFRLTNSTGNDLLNVNSASNMINVGANLTVGASSNIAVIQQAQGDSSGTTTVTFGSNTTVGNTLVVMAEVSSGSNLVGSITGGGVTTWNKVSAASTQDSAQGYDQEVWYGTVTASGSNALTITEANSGTDMVRAIASEVKGLSTSPVDQANAINASASLVEATPTISTTSNNEIVFGFVHNDNSSINSGNGTLGYQNLPSPTPYNVGAYMLTSTIGQQSVNWTASASSSYEGSTVSFFGTGTNSTNAFQVLNASGSAVLNVDSTKGFVGAGASSGDNIHGNSFNITAGNGTGVGGSGAINFYTAGSLASIVPSQDNAASTDAHNASSATLSGFAVGSNSNRLLIVSIDTTNASGYEGINSVKYGTQNMTQLVALNQPYNSNGYSRIEVWYLLAPTNGSASIVATLSSGTADIGIGAISFYDADQSAPAYASNSGVGTSASVTLNNTNVYQMILDTIGGAGDTDTTNSGQTKQWFINNYTDTDGGSTMPGQDGSTSLGWHIGSSDQWGEIALAINPPANTTSDNMTQRMTISNNGYIGIGTPSPSAMLDVAGTSLVKTGSTQAFQVQDASSSALLTVDTVNEQVVIGSGANTLTFSASGGVTATGSFQHKKTIILTPEYAGAVLDNNGASNDLGTMTSGFDSGQRESYYNWTTQQTSANTYDIVLTVGLPADWNSWASSNALKLDTWSDNTSDSTGTITVTGTNGTVEINGGSITPGSASAWATNSFSLVNSDDAASGVMVIRIHMSSMENGSTPTNFRAGNLVLTYNSSY